MNDFARYEPEVAARVFERTPEKACFLLNEFPQQFGITRDEMQAELQSGRLVASGQPLPGGRIGYKNIHIKGDDLVTWLVCGSPTASKAWQHVKALGK